MRTPHNLRNNKKMMEFFVINRNPLSRAQVRGIMNISLKQWQGRHVKKGFGNAGASKIKIYSLIKRREEKYQFGRSNTPEK